jgi:diacylglycerol kinase family enzyme
VDLAIESLGRTDAPESPDALFAVACGVGLDARVMAGATVKLKRRLGFLAYVVATIDQAAKLRPVHFRIDVDGEIHEVEGLVVLIANCGDIIPGVVGPRQAIDPTDGLLDVIVIRGSGLASGLAGSAEALLAVGARPRIGTRSLRFLARRVRVDADPPVAVSRARRNRERRL